MLSFICDRPPTKSFLKEQESSTAIFDYLYSSTDSVEVFLDRALSKVEEARSLWSVAKGNTTHSNMERWGTLLYCNSFVRLLKWLSSGAGESSESEELQSAIGYAMEMGGRLEEVTKEALAIDSGKESDAGTKCSAATNITS
jgi:hypothetical protein